MQEKNLISPKVAGIIFIVLIVISLVAIFYFIPPMAQSVSYHQFADTRQVFGIPNFYNVFSNVFFIIVGLLGFQALHRQWKNHVLSGKEAIVFLTTFIGVFLVGFGSSYYHWMPNNDTLVWDRLPMTIVFMSLLSLTLMERVNTKLGFWLLAPLIAFGIFSVLYWHWTEVLGRGDIRLYGLAQFYTMFLIIAILCIFHKPYPPLKIYIAMFIFYALAKVFESYDLAIYNCGHVVSGHTLKHIFAAISTYWVVVMVNSKKASVSQ